MDQVKEKRIEILQRDIIDLKSKLSSPASDIGDWKIAKCAEARLCNAELPYDINDLNARRQDVRDRINAMQDELDGLMAN